MQHAKVCGSRHSKNKNKMKPNKINWICPFSIVLIVKRKEKHKQKYYWFFLLQLTGKECSRSFGNERKQAITKMPIFQWKKMQSSHTYVVKMACVMTCYQPTRNCYSFRLKFYHQKLRYWNWITRLHLLMQMVILREMDSLYNKINTLDLALAHTHTHAIGADYSYVHSQLIWEVNNFWKLPFIVSNSKQPQRYGTFPNVFLVFFFIGS